MADGAEQCQGDQCESGTDVDRVDVSGSYTTYLEYNKVLRTWFVAFGIGGPALFLVNSAVAQRLVAAGKLDWVAKLFIAGAGAQVLGAFINKVANWYVYYGYCNPDQRGSKKLRAAEWVANQFWIDVILDAATIGLFGWALWDLLGVFSLSSTT